MKKNKKTKVSKKSPLFGGAAKSLRKLGKGTANGIGGLSTTQKVVGGFALVAMGLSYWNKRRNQTTTRPAHAAAAEQQLTAMDGAEASNP